MPYLPSFRRRPESRTTVTSVCEKLKFLFPRYWWNVDVTGGINLTDVHRFRAAPQGTSDYSKPLKSAVASASTAALTSN